MKAIEFFSGIGGMAFALKESGSAVTAAYDQNRTANRVYALNHGLEPSPKNVTSLGAEEIRNAGARLWLLSPPCQPYTIRGRRRDLEDPRAQGLLHLIRLLEECLPRSLLLENVVPFSRSETRERLLETLRRARYRILERTLCPTGLGIPNRRPRYYLLASLDGLQADVKYRRFTSPLAAYLDEEPPAGLAVEPHLIERFLKAVDTASESGIAACFTRSYGRTIVRSGSYLKTAEGFRRFSPAEIARLLHFPASFRFPEGLTLQVKYRLLGNSVNVAVVGELLRHLPRAE
jgi:DNA (cytosine-5)-methyltransferase 1